jgi:hypothetical protein
MLHDQSKKRINNLVPILKSWLLPLRKAGKLNKRRTLCVIAGAIFLLFANNSAFCDIWALAKNAIHQTKSKVSYKNTLSHLRLLTRDENIEIDDENPTTVVIGGGHIILSKDSIRSFKEPEDFKNNVTPEFEFFFKSNDSESTESEEKSETASSKPEKLRIYLDINPNYSLYPEAVGDWTHERFLNTLQSNLSESFQSADASVLILRPAIRLCEENWDAINENPPHLVISNQFNKDNQFNMVIFSAGNILKHEFKSVRQRARFIHSALTGKHVQSALLASKIMERYQSELGVAPLASDQSFFEGSAEPIEKIGNQTIAGVASRNLAMNGIFSQSSIILFPDIRWVRSQVKAGSEEEWIKLYTKTIVNSVIDYITSQALNAIDGEESRTPLASNDEPLQMAT